MRTGQALGGARNAESGETLVELMITVAILGVSMVAILGALWTTLRVADFNSKTSSGDTVLRTFAETMKQGAPTDTYHYVPCTVAGAAVTYPAYAPLAPYNRYDATVIQIEYLTGYDANNQPTFTTDGRCPAATDLGLQQITLKVVGPNNDATVKTTQSMTIVKRDARVDVPRTSTNPANP
jgi:type II secretory pathway pseudopilin PulG